MNNHAPFFPKKSLGQNFLTNTRIVDRIIAACDLKPTDVILEIGPGKGALTHALAQHTKTVMAVEKDRQLAQQLERDFHTTNVTIENMDILDYPFETLPPHVKIIGNLPYNMATPIIAKVLKTRGGFSAFYVTVQLEYGQRMVAAPNTKHYGRLSCFVQYYANSKILFKIKNSAFHPMPKVQSCFLYLQPHKGQKYQTKNENLLFQIIQSCFGQRRKTIANSLCSILEKKQILDLLKGLNIHPKLRAENLTLEEYVRITNAVG